MIAKLAMIDVKRGAPREVLSGIYSHKPRIYGRLADEGCGKDMAFVVMHPTNNFMGHYLMEPLERRGRAILALNSRYLGNDSNLIFERVIQDLGAGIRFLKAQGYKRICLIGNSGGGALAALYQDQAEKLTIRHTPDGQPIDLSPEDLPPADCVALIAAASGRAITYTYRMDAAVLDERDQYSTDPALDVFNPDNGPPFSEAFVARVRAAQIARNRRVTEWCLAKLRSFEKAALPVSDEAFVVYRNNADPRHLDLRLDANDRAATNVKAGNYAANSLGRYTTVRSWLSQWSYDLAPAKGPECLARTTVPVHLAYFTADDVVLPSYYAEWQAAAAGRCERVDFKGVGHYPMSKPEVIESLAGMLVEWADRVCR